MLKDNLLGMDGISSSTWAPNARLAADDLVDDLRIFDGKFIKKVKDSIVVTKTTFNPATGKYDDPNTRVQPVPMMMLTDELISVGGKIGKFSGSIKFEDYDLVDNLAAGKSCGAKCASSSECGTNLFCCPNHHMCMDKSTKSTRGPNCDKAKMGKLLLADNSLTCDSEGNCMLKDDLGAGFRSIRKPDKSIKKA